ncbi:MAG: hypothetical protein ACAI38_08815 [Myxococcota bacterium]
MTTTGMTFIEDVAKMPIMKLPVRTTVIEVSGGRVMFSPGSMMSEAQLKSAGEVTDIIAPSFWHTDGGPLAAKYHPRARLWGPPGIRDKRPKHTWSVLGEDPWPHESELRVFPLAGMPKVREHALYHVPSKSLLVVDLAFNVVDAGGVGATIILKLLSDAYRRFAVSRMLMMLVKDRRAFAASLAPIARLDIARVVPAHGAVLEAEAKVRLLAAFRERKLEVG